MKYNLSKIMLKSWKVYRKTKNIRFAEALHRAWLSAKAEEINAKRIEDATTHSYYYSRKDVLSWQNAYIPMMIL